MKDINDLREQFLNDKFKKYDQGKEKYTMIPQLALKQVARVFTHGADKYGDFNYSKQCDVLRYIDAMQRHTNQYLTGEDMDESTEAVEEEYEIDEAALEEDEELEEVDKSSGIGKGDNKLSEVQAELKEYKEAVSFLKDKLHEVNILNAKLLFTNKLFKQ